MAILIKFIIFFVLASGSTYILLKSNVGLGASVIINFMFGYILKDILDNFFNKFIGS